MCQEDFVSYELAKKLKECGFDEPCGYSYYIHAWMDEPRLVTSEIAESEAESFDGTDIYSAPTLCLAQKWLREKKDIDVLVYNCACGYIWELSKSDVLDRGTILMMFDDNGEDRDSGCWLTYEAALSAGIAAALGLTTKGE